MGYFGSLGKAIVTCFRAMIGDVGLPATVGPLFSLSAPYAVIFVAYVVFMIFGVLNVLIGLFCDAAMQATEKDRQNMLQDKLDEEAELRETLMRVFQSSDSDFSGEISREEFVEMIHKDELR